jgi:hypothetical protein
MLPSTNMLEMKCQVKNTTLRQMTVFAAIAGTRSHSAAKVLIHA